MKDSVYCLSISRGHDAGALFSSLALDSLFQGFAPDTDLDNVRDRVIGILFGLIVTGLVFHYIWPERVADRGVAKT